MEVAIIVSHTIVVKPTKETNTTTDTTTTTCPHCGAARAELAAAPPPPPPPLRPTTLRTEAQQARMMAAIADCTEATALKALRLGPDAIRTRSVRERLRPMVEMHRAKHAEPTDGGEAASIALLDAVIQVAGDEVEGIDR